MAQRGPNRHSASLLTARAGAVTEMLIHKTPDQSVSGLDAIRSRCGPRDEMLDGAHVRLSCPSPIAAALQRRLVQFNQAGNLDELGLVLESEADIFSPSGLKSLREHRTDYAQLGIAASQLSQFRFGYARKSTSSGLHIINDCA